MRKNQIERFVGVLMATLLVAGHAAAQEQLGSEFSYQGQLTKTGNPLNDTADFEFTLWDADTAGNMIGSEVAVDDVAVKDGLFTVELDFGVPAFNGEKRWLEIAVRSPAGGGEFTTLDPRQPMTAAPYALQTRGIFVTAGGNVGIGTTTPGAKLGVAGGIRVGGKIINAGGLTLSGGGGGVRILMDEDGGSTDVFTIWDTDVELFRVHGGTGNVGIGTTNPERSLHILGDLLLIERAGNEPGVMLKNTGNGSVKAFFGLRATGPDTGFAYITDEHLQRVIFLRDGNMSVGSGPTANRLSVNGDADFTGKVGIGTTTPSTKLEVAGTVTATAFSSTSPLQLQTAGTTRIYADDDTGNVGIGTMNPSAALDVVGTTELNGNLSVATDTLWVNATTNKVGIGTNSPSKTLEVVGRTALNGDVFINEGNLTVSINRLWVNGQTGRVGIGTTNPAETLDVSGEIRFGNSEFYPAAYDRKTVIVAGKITQDGDIDRSVTSSAAIIRAKNDTTGDYTVTFDSDTFAITPIVTVTAFDSDGGNNKRFASITRVSRTEFHIKILNHNGEDRDSSFNFIAIGER